MFTPKPTYQYRIREENRPITTHAYLTRGQFNACETGRFLGFVHELDLSKIDIMVYCPKCNDNGWWDCARDIKEDEFAECESCGTVCVPVVPLQQQTASRDALQRAAAKAERMQDVP